MIVGTAGHIDHGKTSLVRALTGVDTDRLKEEKARGITIELGYAYQPLANGEMLGFIDVPGHERFIHTMLAGAAGIDYGLLVVAADDGVMPQTREHLDILELLGLEQGAVALSKIDRVEAARLAEVEAEIRTLLAATPLRDAAIFPVSAITGAGIDALRAHLHAVAAASSRGAAQGGFRLAVDRSFSLKGTGTVVTGTVFAGRAQVGDELVLTPSGKRARLRGLHVMNRAAESGQAGQRCALNLAGLDKDEIARGDWVVAPALHAPSRRFDARIRLSHHAAQALRHWQPVHLHLGAAHTMAHVALLEDDSLAAGASGLAQLVLDQPIGVLYGDAFVLRDASARHTLGGGRVLDPWAPARQRKTPQRLAELVILQEADPTRRLHGLLASASLGLDLTRLATAWNGPELAGLLPRETRRIAAAGRELAFASDHWQALAQQVLAGLADFHTRFPDELGPETARARRMLLPRLEAAAFTALVGGLVADRRIERSGPCLHLPEHRISLNPQEQALYERIRPWLLETPDNPPWVRDLARRAEVDEAVMRRLLLKLARQGEVYQVVHDLFYAPEAVAALAAVVRELEQAAGETRAASFRDHTGIGRRRCIQLLEFFDRIGYTRRVREAHRLRSPEMFGQG
ncbi:MAG: selenocysteine-specific translation elongation factor [Hydrogenophilaceae bacterium]|nr:selenocysteine-specific translation elongation factor [Hydrogenophilaceae bacterium]